MNNRPKILITNDDSYSSTGIEALTQSAINLGAEVTVVAPLHPNSGKSSAITVASPLRLTQLKETDNLKIYTCDGTPVDCIKLAIEVLFKEQKPDLILSGINHGSNSAVSVLYSGTMGAAIEGCLKGIPSIGFSLDDHAMDADFTDSIKICTDISKDVLKNKLPIGTCLNVNIPKGDNVKGYRVARQTKGSWINEFKKTQDGIGKDVYWLTGCFENDETEDTLTDEYVLKQRYVSIVPVKIDMTDYELFANFNRWNRDF